VPALVVTLVARLVDDRVVSLRTATSGRPFVEVREVDLTAIAEPTEDVRCDAERPPTTALARCAAAALAASVTVIAAAAVAVGRFALPAFDDFMRATRRGRSDHDLGWWGYVFGFTYNRWQGRWASCGIESAVLPHVDPTRLYPLLIGLVAALNAAGLYVACRGLTRNGPRRLALAMTAAGLALLWAGMPSVAEAIYWFVGAVENTLPLAAAAVLLTVLAKSGTRGPVVAVACVGAFVTVGLHELYGAMLCLALLVGAIGAFRARSPNRLAWLAATAWAAAGLAVVLAAPGNGVRLTDEVNPLGRGPARVLLLTIDQLWINGRAWLFDAKLIAATVWVAFSPALEGARRPWPSAARVPWRWVIPVTWLLTIAIGFAVPSYAFGGEMPDRTLSGNYVVFVAGWLLSVYAWTRPLAVAPAPPAWQKYRNPVAAAAAQLLLAAALLGVGTAFSAAEDLAHRLRPWHAAAERRYAQLRRAGGGDAVVRPLPPPPYLLLGGEVVDDPADYRNRGPVAFFRLHRLTLSAAPPRDR
jgi:hypothetical protein